jgi:hypothetical protein
LRFIERLVYEVRWWHWFLFTGQWPFHTLYGGAYRLDRDSRRRIIERVEKEKASHEPAYHGRYIKRIGKPRVTGE